MSRSDRLAFIGVEIVLRKHVDVVEEEAIELRGETVGGVLKGDVHDQTFVECSIAKLESANERRSSKIHRRSEPVRRRRSDRLVSVVGERDADDEEGVSIDALAGEGE